ncbi:MAG TPA: bifunctional ADP-heptose synthase, partial [Segetibacter sp.]
FDNLSKLKVAVVGDVMLDTYWWGNVERISPEAPVPIVALKKRDFRVGGAGNVALNTVALNASTTLFSIIGNDTEGEQLIQLLKEGNINTDDLIKSTDRITTSKTRVMSRNQQMMRLDSETTKDITQAEQEELLQKFTTYVEAQNPSVVILEDYNKGILSETVITQILAICKSKNIVTTVDPKRKNFFSYKGATIFKPNLKEIKDALNMVTIDISQQSLESIHQQLNQHLQHKISLITLSESGIFYGDGTSSTILPTHIRNIADVSGAGDTVIAVASLVYASTNDIHLASSIANIAGGLVCEEVGTVSISKKELIEECKKLIQ